MYKFERIAVYVFVFIFVISKIFLYISNISNDSQKALDEAINKLVERETAAASYFESLNAYSASEHKEALNKAYSVWANYGIPFEPSIQILEAQQRAFGTINPKSTELFVGFWAMHGREQTPNLIRWMGTADINSPEEQGKIMRIIAAISGQSNMPTSKEIIIVLSSQGSRFRYLGWSPEETLINLSKIMVPGEGIEPVRCVLDAIYKAPSDLNLMENIKSLD